MHFRSPTGLVIGAPFLECLQGAPIGHLLGGGGFTGLVEGGILAGGGGALGTHSLRRARVQNSTFLFSWFHLTACLYACVCARVCVCVFGGGGFGTEMSFVDL